jgi:ATP-dependent protease Clp ATPase subunit
VKSLGFGRAAEDGKFSTGADAKSELKTDLKTDVKIAGVGAPPRMEETKHERRHGAPSPQIGKVAGPSDSLQFVQPEDLVAYGMIPEFIGRVPVIASLTDLDEEALLRILTEPRNALVKQFRRLFELDGVALELTDEALRACARLALERRTGARGLRAILENAMLEIMYEIPSRGNVERILVNEEVITKGKPPLVELRNVS